MDSLTHALAISVGFALLGRPDLIPFAALGAVIPDIDVTFQRFSDRDPKLYIFTHGGITHSVIGAVVTATIFAVFALIAVPAAFPGLLSVSPALAIWAAIAGVLSHLLLDYLAYPGIPLLYPLSDRKFTFGIMAGPSAFLTAASLIYLAFIAAGRASIDEPWIYVYFFIAVIGISGGLKAYVGHKVDGMAIPGLIPLNWLIVRQTSDSVLVCSYSLIKGPLRSVSYAKSKGPRAASLTDDSLNLELRRMRYHSYVVVEEHDGTTVRYSDPLREHGHLWYPPYFKSVSVPVEKVPGR